MNNKEFDLQILAALTEYANGLVAAGHVMVEENGQYTAHNLANEKNDMGEPLHVDFEERNEPKKIQVDGFTCTVTPYTVFALICKFESICKVKASGKVRFKFGDGCEETIIKEKTMFVTYQRRIKVQRKTLRKLAEHTATDKSGAMYYQVRPGGIWYEVASCSVRPETIEEQMTAEFVRDGIKNINPESPYREICAVLLEEMEHVKEEEQIKPTEQTEQTNEVKVNEPNKPKRTQGARFTFSTCGIKPGEQVTFTPENIEVTVADDTHVEFCGELFTLSGFCRAFMPDDKRKPSNAYQGTKYFTYNGVTLLKLRECKTEEVTPCVEVETKAVDNITQKVQEKTKLPHCFEQERTGRHERPTIHEGGNNGLRRTILHAANVYTLQGFTTVPKYGTPRYVVNTLPLPPPKMANRYGFQSIKNNN